MNSESHNPLWLSIPHVPQYPGNYCFSCSIHGSYICLATSACFPKLYYQTKSKDLHIHIVCPCRTCPVLVPLVPCFQLSWVSSLADRQQLALLFLVCKCISCCSSLETNQCGQALFLVEMGGITHCSLCRLSAVFGLGLSALSSAAQQTAGTCLQIHHQECLWWSGLS